MRLKVLLAARLLSGLSLLFIAHQRSGAQSAPAPPADTLALPRLHAAMEAFQRSEAARYGTVALSVRRVRDGRCLYEYNAHQSLPTASTLKLVTTATALAVLGPAYRYVTTLAVAGTVQDSVLTGDVYVQGSGDPSLGSWRYTGYPNATQLLRVWSDAVWRAGIRRIDGAVVGDASLYDHPTTPSTWPWGDLGNYYGASPGALNINENQYRVVFRPGRTVGAATALARTEPPLPYLTLHNRVTTAAAGTGDEVNIYGAPFSFQQWLEGTVPAGNEFGVKGALPDAAYHVAYSLTEQLRQDSLPVSQSPVVLRYGLPAARYASGMGVGGSPNVSNAGRRTTLWQQQSPPLRELAQQTNFQSINLYAEALLLTTARTLAKRPVPIDEAVNVVADYWRKKGVNLEGYRPRDGSGLSTVGAMTTSNMTGILAAAGQDKSFAPFYETIPVVGESGTVRSLARGTAAAGNVRAKSGSIEGVRAYAGYFTAADGELMTFAVFVNKFTPGQNRAVTGQLTRILTLLVALAGSQ